MPPFPSNPSSANQAPQAPSGAPSAATKPNFHDQMKELASRLENDTFGFNPKEDNHAFGRFGRHLKITGEKKEVEAYNEFVDYLGGKSGKPSDDVRDTLVGAIPSSLKKREGDLNTPSSPARARRLIGKVGSEVKSRVPELENNLKDLKADNINSEAKINRLTLDLQSAEAYLTEQRQEIKRLREEVEKNLTEKAEALKMLEDKERDVQDSDKKIASIQNELKDFQNQFILSKDIQTKLNNSEAVKIYPDEAKQLIDIFAIAMRADTIQGLESEIAKLTEKLRELLGDKKMDKNKRHILENFILGSPIFSKGAGIKKVGGQIVRRDDGLIHMLELKKAELVAKSSSTASPIPATPAASSTGTPTASPAPSSSPSKSSGSSSPINISYSFSVPSTPSSASPSSTPAAAPSSVTIPPISPEEPGLKHQKKVDELVVVISKELTDIQKDLIGFGVDNEDIPLKDIQLASILHQMENVRGKIRKIKASDEEKSKPDYKASLNKNEILRVRYEKIFDRLEERFKVLDKKVIGMHEEQIEDMKPDHVLDLFIDVFGGKLTNEEAYIKRPGTNERTTFKDYEQAHKVKGQLKFPIIDIMLSIKNLVEDKNITDRTFITSNREKLTEEEKKNLGLWISEPQTFSDKLKASKVKEFEKLKNLLRSTDTKDEAKLSNLGVVYNLKTMFSDFLNIDGNRGGIDDDRVGDAVEFFKKDENKIKLMDKYKLTEFEVNRIEKKFRTWDRTVQLKIIKELGIGQDKGRDIEHYIEHKSILTEAYNLLHEESAVNRVTEHLTDILFNQPKKWLRVRGKFGGESGKVVSRLSDNEIDDIIFEKLTLESASRQAGVALMSVLLESSGVLGTTYHESSGKVKRFMEGERDGIEIHYPKLNKALTDGPRNNPIKDYIREVMSKGVKRRLFHVDEYAIFRNEFIKMKVSGFNTMSEPPKGLSREAMINLSKLVEDRTVKEGKYSIKDKTLLELMVEDMIEKGKITKEEVEEMIKYR